MTAQRSSVPGISAKDYVSYTYQSPVAIKRWLHQKRFCDALQLLELKPRDSVLDYGAGDGHFLEIAAELHDSALLYGYEPAEELFQQARQKLAAGKATIAKDMAMIGSMKFDRIVCMEVCEHLLDADLHQLFSSVTRLLAPGGIFMASVPIESGLPAAAKNAFRYLEYRNQGHDYLSWGIYFRAIFGLPMSREAEFLSGLPYVYSHIGFNFRSFERALRSQFAIRRRFCSPANFLGAGLNNTAYYLCTPIHSSQETDG